MTNTKSILFPFTHYETKRAGYTVDLLHFYHSKARRSQGNTEQSNAPCGRRFDRIPFTCPDSFARAQHDSNTFAWYLEHLSLKPEGELVKYYNGETKDGEYVYCAVVDMPISGKDLQQCADAVMRLRGEYLFSMKRYANISFRFTGDGKMHGFREYAKGDYSYKNFRKYMDYVFGYANTSSLKKQLKSIPFSQMQIGDVLVQSGNPYGHAVIIVDICINAKGEKQYMLAQSYMPAQETQVLVKPGTTQPWYSHPGGSVIATPEWTFDTADLRRW